MKRRRNRYDLLLDAVVVESDDPIGAVLAAARAPGGPEELTGLAAAMAAYSAAGIVADGSAGSPVMGSSHHGSGIPSQLRPAALLKGLAAASLVTKLVAGAVAVAAAGGIALATTTTVDHIFHAPAAPAGTASANSSPRASTSPSGPSSHALPSSTTSAQPGPATAGAAVSGGTGAPRTTTVQSTPPQSNPSLRGLCQAWNSRPHNHGNADNTPAFARLIAAAGGKGNVDAYCTDLLAGDNPSTPTTPTSTPTHRTGKPTAPPGKPNGSSHGKRKGSGHGKGNGHGKGH